MQINYVILNIFDGFFSQQNTKGMTKFGELERMKIESIFAKEKPVEKPKLLVKTIGCQYKLNDEQIQLQPMSVLNYEYAINWWRKKNGHFNEELYKTILIERCPELFK